MAALVLAVLVTRWNSQRSSRPPGRLQNSTLVAWRTGNFTVTFRGALSMEECSKIRTLLEGTGEAALVGGTMGGMLRENVGVRVAQMLTLEPSHETRWIFERLWQLAEVANEHWKLRPLLSGRLPEEITTDLMPEAQREGRLLSFSIQLSNSTDARRNGKWLRLALVGWIRGRLNHSLASEATAAHLRAIEDTRSWKALQKTGPKKAQSALPRAPLGLQRIYGSHLLHTGHAEEAAHVLRRVAMEDPHSPGALNNLAVAEYRQGRMHAAIDALLFAASLRPNDGEVHANLGRFFFLEGCDGVASLCDLANLNGGIFWCFCLRLVGYPQAQREADDAADLANLTAEEKRLQSSKSCSRAGFAVAGFQRNWRLVANLNTVPQWWLRTGGFEQVREEQPAEFRAFALPYRPYRPKTTRVEES
ncbi:unnamed protein product, partial [Cladocopium goreaui]